MPSHIAPLVDSILTEPTIADTLSVDHMEDIPDDAWDEEKLVEGLQNSSVISLIQRLPDKYKEVLVLYYYQDLKVEDICSVLNEPSGTIKSKLHRGRNMLKEMLLKEGVSNG